MSNLFKKIDAFVKLANKKCQFCGCIINTGDFCSEKCENAAFEEDLNNFVNDKIDVNYAKCVGDKKAPVGSPRQRSFCKRMCRS